MGTLDLDNARHLSARADLGWKGGAAPPDSFVWCGKAYYRDPIETHALRASGGRGDVYATKYRGNVLIVYAVTKF